VSLDDYIGRMQAGQDDIWVISAETHAAAAGSPQLEALKAKNIEVLLLSDRIDEWMLNSLTEYKGKRIRNAAKGELPLDESDKRKQDEASKQAEPLLERIKTLLGDRVGDVKVSARLVDSPSCLALADHEMAPHLARLLREAGQEIPQNKPVLEVNPSHALLKRLEGEGDDAKASDLALLLLEQAEVAAGAPLDDPAAFLKRVNRLIAS